MGQRGKLGFETVSRKVTIAPHRELGSHDGCPDRFKVVTRGVVSSHGPIISCRLSVGRQVKLAFSSESHFWQGLSTEN